MAVKKFKKPKFVLYGTSGGVTKKFGTYDSLKEAGTAEGIHMIDLGNSGFEGNVVWSIKKKSSVRRKKKF